MSEIQLIEKMDEDIEMLHRHIAMLRAIRDNEPIGIIKLSEITGLPKHKIRYSLRLLEKDKVISPSQEGAVTTELYEKYMTDMGAYIVKLKENIDRLESILPVTL